MLPQPLPCPATAPRDSTANPGEHSAMSHPTTTIFPTATSLLLTLSTVACGDSNEATGDGLGVAVEDSAGITIVENEPPPPDSRLPWQFGTQPSLSIGSVDSGAADELFEVTDATRLADGRIVIANSGSSELRVFNADGSHAATWGRRGEGPGEFTYGPSAVASWPGDSIAAPNPGGREVSLFDLDGNHGRDLALNAIFGNVVALMPDGKIVASSVMIEPETSESSNPVRYITEWAVLDADGTQQASFGVFLETEHWTTQGPDGSIQTSAPHPFGRQTSSAAWGELVAIGVQDSYEIKVFAADGTLVRIVRRGGAPESPSQEDMDALFDLMLGNLPDAARARARSMLLDLPLLESFPAFEEILADRVGYLWVREYRKFGEEDAVWTVFDPEGRVQGLVETPAGLNVFEIGEDYVLGSAQDELGVEYVHVWGLDRG